MPATPTATPTPEIVKNGDIVVLFTSDVHCGVDKGLGYVGLWEIRKYLLKDSLFYVKAEEYAKGVDITFVSSHTIENPEYTELEVTDYTEYSDDCFSIHIHFIKNMRLVKGNRRVTSTMDSTFYFIYVDDSDDGEDNPHWTLGDMIAGAKQNYGTEEED